MIKTLLDACTRVPHQCLSQKDSRASGPVPRHAVARRGSLRGRMHVLRRGVSNERRSTGAACPGLGVCTFCAECAAACPTQALRFGRALTFGAQPERSIDNGK